MTEQQRLEKFLRESNKIEGVHDEQSFIDALQAWEYLISQDELTVKVVLTVHKILMQNQDLKETEKGIFRDVPVYIGGREGLYWRKIKGHVDGWVAQMNSNNPVGDWWKRLHVDYERIHPFIDGNGRTGRMFMNWHRIKIFKQQILIIKAAERQKYYQWFSK